MKLANKLLQLHERHNIPLDVDAEIKRNIDKSVDGMIRVNDSLCTSLGVFYKEDREVQKFLSNFCKGVNTWKNIKKLAKGKGFDSIPEKKVRKIEVATNQYFKNVNASLNSLNTYLKKIPQDDSKYILSHTISLLREWTSLKDMFKNNFKYAIDNVEMK